MQAIEELRRRTAGATDLLQVVRTMRAIAVAGVREFEVAEQALARYESAVGQGLALAWPDLPSRPASNATRATDDGPVGVIAFGSDHGLVGRFNETLAEYVRGLVSARREMRLIVLGARLAARLSDLSPKPEAESSMPRTAGGVTGAASDVLVKVEEWQSQGVDEILLVHNTWAPSGTYSPRAHRLVPFDPAIIAAENPWPRRTVPIVLGHKTQVATGLLDQYLRAIVARALTRSLVAENEARLTSTRGAEHNIGERIDELRREYRQAYQGAETEELLDVLAGFEAITSGR
jgi:F-type H+-transporting ATPase subunit gamma